MQKSYTKRVWGVISVHPALHLPLQSNTPSSFEKRSAQRILQQKKKNFFWHLKLCSEHFKLLPIVCLFVCGWKVKITGFKISVTIISAGLCVWVCLFACVVACFEQQTKSTLLFGILWLWVWSLVCAAVRAQNACFSISSAIACARGRALWEEYFIIKNIT